MLLLSQVCYMMAAHMLRLYHVFVLYLSTDDNDKEQDVKMDDNKKDRLERHADSDDDEHSS